MKPIYIAASLLASAAFASPTMARDLIVNSYGGPYEQIIRDAIITPFEQEYGVRVIYDAVGSSSQDYAKIKATNGRPGFDVVVMTASQSLQGCEDGLLERFSPDTVPNLAHLNPEISAVAGPCGAVHELQYLSLLYRTDMVSESPQSWLDLFEDDLTGRVILPSFGNVMAAYLTQLMSVIHGGDLDSDIDPGFEAMTRLAAQSVGFEQASAILESYIVDGRVWAMPFWDGRAQLLVDSGAPVDYVLPEEGSVPLIATLNVPIGAQNKELALAFVDFFLEKTSQERWVEGYKVGSARADIEVSDQAQDRKITSQADLDALYLPDLLSLASNLSAWGERWEREVVPAAR
ncbi:ABC transporter substrate-binding protein [Pelagibacterium luteolum]|uniref:Putative spermidine/putrescine transport system substrate-binding protein n=1 Tax=Pelagibacterium luteolum TaxID=440168 RepID=A0A1G8A7K2_9HYPH|nr:ABC transporter substrate-binding protein [Pelagibacterium luteolum]SDH16965.1 putative spermidine/putrescine transport system substrate-binding protein [Pelagibacterium luteolum]